MADQNKVTSAIVTGALAAGLSGPASSAPTANSQVADLDKVICVIDMAGTSRSKGTPQASIYQRLDANSAEYTLDSRAFTLTAPAENPIVKAAKDLVGIGSPAKPAHPTEGVAGTYTGELSLYQVGKNQFAGTDGFVSVDIKGWKGGKPEGECNLQTGELETKIPVTTREGKTFAQPSAPAPKH